MCAHWLRVIKRPCYIIDELNYKLFQHFLHLSSLDKVRDVYEFGYECKNSLLTLVITFRASKHLLQTAVVVFTQLLAEKVDQGIITILVLVWNLHQVFNMGEG